ncbi:MAG: thioredoxin family protein, partial [Planctomycetota bacterium]
SRAATALDNPVNEARAADKPALVAFSSAGCCGPDEVAPLLNAVRGKWDEALSIVYIDAASDPVLAARYNVRTVPTLIVYDKQGEETARWNRVVGLDVLAEEFKEAGIESGGTH